MRHGFTTLIQSQNCRANDGSNLACPLLRNKRVHAARTAITSLFWDNQVLIMIDYLEQGRMINGAYYAGELRWLRQKIERKRQGKLTLSVPLLQDNVPAHTSQVVITAATECGFKILTHLPYYPDMALSDFYLLLNLKSHLRGTQY